MTNALEYTVAIPTMDRPAELRRCLRSVLHQRPLPRRVVVFDDGALDPRPFERWITAHGIEWVHVRKQRRGLVASLNLVADHCITKWVLILDDDIVLGRTFIARLAGAIERHPEAVGLAGYPVQSSLERRSLRRRMRIACERFFLLGGGVEGRFLSSSFCTDYQGGHHPRVPYATDHVPGGLGLWQTEVLRTHRYDESYAGYGAGNDKEFSFRVGQQHALVAVPGARALHVKSPRSRPGDAALGRMRVTNKHRFYVQGRRAGRFTPLAYAWALLGSVLLAIAGALTQPLDAARWRELAGMCGGLLSIMLGGGARTR